MEQRVNINFGFKQGKTPTETYEMVQTVYGNEALSRSSVFEWFTRFKTGVRILRMIQEVGVVNHLEMQNQSQMSVKW
jgi:hypothetical protein